MSALLGIDPRELATLARVADRRLAGSPLLPHGDTPRRDRAGRGIEFLDLRPYLPGDPVRDVDWRATARVRHPQIRRHRDEAFSSVYLCIDRSASMAGGSDNRTIPTAPKTKWQLARQLTASLAYLLLHGGNRVGLITFSDTALLRLPASRGRSAYSRLLAVLLETDLCRRGDSTRLESCREKIHSGDSVAVLSDFLSPDFLRTGIEALSRHGAHLQLFRIRDPRDIRLPARMSRTTILRDIESGTKHSLSLDRAEAEAAARHRLCELDTAMDRYCRARQIPIIPCHTQKTWRETLVDHLRGLPPLHA